LDNDLVKIYEFSNEEFDGLTDDYFNKRMKHNDVLLTMNGVEMKVSDFEHLRQESYFTKATMSFFLKYLEVLQNADKHFFGEKNRFHYMSLVVNYFERYEKKSHYAYLSQMENRAFANPAQIFQDYDKMCLVIFYDER